MKVYVVTEAVEGVEAIVGIYAKHENAFEVAKDIADYAGFELEPDDDVECVWHDGRFAAPGTTYVMIEEHILEY
jgi:hypothetical protein